MFSHPDLPTIFATIIVSCLALAATLAWGSRGARDGLAIWALGLVMQASVFALLDARGVIADAILAAGGNLLLAVAMALFLAAIHQFQQTPQNRAGVFLPPLLLGFGLLFTVGELHARITLANLVYLVQIALIGLRLLRFRYDFPTRGRNLILAGMVLYVVGATSRIWTAAFRPEALHEFLHPTAPQSVAFFSVFAAIVLTSNGFVMMTKERSDARLRDFARRDSLTGCWNRVRIEEVAERERARLRRYGHPVAAILVDLDHFKEVNDRFGHAVGDAVLKDFAKIARISIRDTDILGRWGGEEFIAILPMSGLADAAAIAERLRTRVRAHAFAGGVRITASIGVAACLTSDTWAEWLQRADTALYRAKAEGRDAVRIEGVELGSGPTADAVRPTRLIWRNGYASGSPEIDAQHRALFANANALIALADSAANKDEIIAEVRAFLAREVAHFADEERLIATADYGNAHDHAQLHRDLLARAEDLLARYANDEIAASGVLDFVVHELFADHILTEDTRFRAVFEA